MREEEPYETCLPFGFHILLVDHRDVDVEYEQSVDDEVVVLLLEAFTLANSREAGASPPSPFELLSPCATRLREASASPTELHSSADTRPSHTHVGTLQAAKLRQGESSLEDPSLSPRPVRLVAVCLAVCWA